MFSTLKNKVRAFIALFFVAVLLGSLLVKPVHILLVDHDLTEVMQTSATSGVLSTPQHDCTICSFEFCFFIPQSQIKIPKVDVAFVQKITPPTTERITNKNSHHFRLRGPPTVWILPPSCCSRTQVLLLWFVVSIFLINKIQCFTIVFSRIFTVWIVV